MKPKPFDEQHPELKAAVLDPETAVMYTPWEARFAFWELATRNSNYGWVFSKLNGKNPVTTRGFSFCPWSGNRLFSNINNAWYRRIRRIGEKYSIDIHDLIYEELDLIPAMLKDETWWIKEGIEFEEPDEKEKWIWEIKEDFTLDGDDYLGEDGNPISWEPGIWRFRIRPPHLCRGFSSAMWDSRTSIAYIPWTREYGFRRYEVGRPPRSNPIRIRKFDYCYSCGAKLPSSLKAHWLEEIAAAGYTPNDEDLPPEFLSDEWWKKRGL